MALRDLFKPDWQHSSPQRRLTAVASLGHEDTDKLLSLVRQDPDTHVRRAALERLDSLDILRQLLADDLPGELLDLVRAKLNAALRATVMQASDGAGREQALASIDDHAILAEIAEETADSALRLKAISLIPDEQILARLATANIGPEAGQAAVSRISNEALLQRLKKDGGNKTIRRQAEERLLALYPPPVAPAPVVPAPVENAPDPVVVAEPAAPGPGAAASPVPALAPSGKERNTAILEALCIQVEHLEPVPESAKVLAECRNDWQLVDPRRSHPLAARFTESAAKLDARLKELEQARQAALAHEAEVAAARVIRHDLLAKLKAVKDPSVAGSAEILASAQDAWLAAGPLLPDLVVEFDSAWQQEVARLRAGFDEVTTEQSHLAELTSLVQRLEALPETCSREQLNDIRRQWRERAKAISLKHLDSTALRQRADAALQKANAALQVFEQSQAAKRTERLDKLTQLTTAIEELAENEEATDAERRGKDLHQQGLAILADLGEAEGRAAKQFDEAWQLFRKKQKELEDLKDWDRWANQETKEKLIAEVEAFDPAKEPFNGDLRALAKAIKEVQARWKQTGPVRRADSQAQWQRFKVATDTKFALCKAFFEEEDQKRQEHLKRKQALLEEAEKLAASDASKEVAERLKALQAEWKQVGQGPRDEEELLHKRFRAACGAFFGKWHEQIEHQRQDREVHAEKKRVLMAEAEALAVTVDWRQVERVKALQVEWKQVGPAPREQEAELWQRFHTACNAFFALLDGQRAEHQQAKEKLLAELEAFLASPKGKIEAHEAGKRVQEFQQRWKDIGPATREGEEALWQRFHAACDGFFRARRTYQEKVSAERQEALKQKEALIAQAKAVIAADSKTSTDELKALQTQWKTIGPAPRERDQQVWEEFRDVCNGYFAKRRQVFEEQDKVRQENLRQAEAFCARLEHLVTLLPPPPASVIPKAAPAPAPAPKAEPPPAPKNKNLSLAEELKLAFAANFAHGGSRTQGRPEKPERGDRPDRGERGDRGDRGDRNDRGDRSERPGSARPRLDKAMIDEIHGIQDGMNALGYLPRGAEDTIRHRYRTAMALLHGETPPPPPKPAQRESGERPQGERQRGGKGQPGKDKAPATPADAATPDAAKPEASASPDVPATPAPAAEPAAEPTAEAPAAEPATTAEPVVSPPPATEPTPAPAAEAAPEKPAAG